MQEFFSLIKTLYISFIMICQIMVIINFYILNKKNAQKNYLTILPLYYTFLTCLGFMTIMMAGLKGWIFGIITGAIWILILVLTIKTYKLARYNKIFDTLKVKKKYLLDLILYFILSLMVI